MYMKILKNLFFLQNGRSVTGNQTSSHFVLTTEHIEVAQVITVEIRQVIQNIIALFPGNMEHLPQNFQINLALVAYLLMFENIDLHQHVLTL